MRMARPLRGKRYVATTARGFPLSCSGSQTPTLGKNSILGASAYTANLLRPFPGLGVINQNTTGFWDTYHSLQISVTRRFAKGFSFGANYTRELNLVGNTFLVQRCQHGANGAITLRSDEAAYEAMNQNL